VSVRYNFGADSVLWTVGPDGPVSASGTFWTALVGGTQYTDLLLNGASVTSVQTDADGRPPTFQGPQGVLAMYADFGAGRFLAVTTDIVALLGDVIAGLAPGSGGVSSIDGLTGAVSLAQSYVALALLGTTNGVAQLGADGKLLSSQLPSIAVTTVDTVSSQAAMLALPVTKGAIAIRSDITVGSTMFILAANDPTVLGNWINVPAPGNVTSVNGHTGAVNLGAADVGADTAGLASAAQTNAINDAAAKYVPLLGGTMTGDLALGGHLITGVGTPTANTHAANKGYVDTAVANLVAAAPGTLDTLKELADALGDDPSFATTVSANLAGKVAKAGDTMTGDLAMGTHKVTGLGTPTAANDAAPKTYVDTAVVARDNPRGPYVGATTYAVNDLVEGPAPYNGEWRCISATSEASFSGWSNGKWQWIGGSGYGTAAQKTAIAATGGPDGYIYFESDTNGGTPWIIKSGAWKQLSPGVTAANGFQLDYKSNTSVTAQTVASGATIDVTSLTGLTAADTARPVYFTVKLQLRMSANSAGASGFCAVTVGIVETTAGGFTESYPVPCVYLASGLASSNGAVIAGADNTAPVVTRYGASLANAGAGRTFKVTATGGGSGFTYTIRNSKSEFWAEAK
jgi:hypothetical protein